MAAEQASGARPVRGSLLTEDGLLVRVTMRCLREDLGLRSRVPFATLVDGPIGEVFRDAQVVSDDGPRGLSLPTVVLSAESSRLVVHPEGDGRLLWVVACGLADAEVGAADAAGRLAPTPGDVQWLESDVLVSRLRRLQTEAPLALAAARRDHRLPVEIPAVAPAASLRVGGTEDGTVTLVAIVLRPDAQPSARDGRMIALMLNAVRAGADWRLLAEAEPLAHARALLGVEPDALDAPVCLIFADGALPDVMEELE